MHVVSRYKVLTIGILTFMLVSLVYFLVLSDRVKPFKPFVIPVSHSESKTEIRSQEEITSGERPGIQMREEEITSGEWPGNWIQEEIINESVLLTQHVKKATPLLSTGNGTTPKIEDLDSYVMAERVINLTRYATIFKPANSVERDKDRNGLKVPSKDAEEFTIVMMTYKRTEMMLKLLQHLSGLPKLNQLLLIWNNEQLPGPEISWPNVNYALRLLVNGKNTLHNRYLPLSIVETEAIFLLDDDSFVDHERVLEAFQIWQFHRDQIVGFKGRGVKWRRQINDTKDTGHWEYDTQVSPERVSMVLTGSAFIHRNFMDLYTYKMPKEMRKIIDETMNCDDLAVNFLVSDVVQKSPIYVPHGKDFLCPGCTDNGLWKDASHFSERTKCLNQFSEIMGYTPLYKQGYKKRVTKDCPRFPSGDLAPNLPDRVRKIFITNSSYSQHHSHRIFSSLRIIFLLHSILGSLVT